jgi:hypothetical protein
MSFEHFYQVIDRPAVNQLLGLTWPQFHRKYRWRHSQWPTAEDFLWDFALADENDREQLSRILRTRTLRWTMLRSTAQFHFMVEMIVQAPDVSKQCPQFWCQGLAASYMFLGAAAKAFLDGRLSKRVLRTIFALNVGPCELGGLNLRADDRQELEDALKPWQEPPGMFGWLQGRELFEGYCQLGLPDTQRFLKFVLQSWSESWPCPYLGRAERAELPSEAQKSPTMRDNEIAKTLVRWLRKSNNKQARNLTMFRYFG